MYVCMYSYIYIILYIYIYIFNSIVRENLVQIVWVVFNGAH